MADAYMKRTEFVLERVFRASPERVYRAWTDPADISRWIWASMGRDVWAELDVSVGGAYRVYTRHKGGVHQGADWSGMCGVYVEVEPHRKLVMTVHWDADVGYNQGGALALDEVVIVTFDEVPDGTRMTWRHLGIPDDSMSVNGHRMGVAESLEILAGVVEE